MCAECGLPKWKATPMHVSRLGQMWVPPIRGVEVCGCPSNEDALHDRIAEVQREIVKMRHTDHRAE
jgi:hypothetical protein